MEQKEVNDDTTFSRYFSRVKEESFDRSVLLNLEEEFHKVLLIYFSKV